MSKLAGKVAVVTGASKGIGAGIAKALAAQGASVVVNYATSREGADAVVAAITAKGGKATAVQGDVTKAAEAEALVASAIDTYGRLDILVNNAGVYEWAQLAEITEDSYRRQFDTNVLGLLLATKAADPHLGQGASVINISSTVTRLHLPGSTVYTATKGAVDAINGVLAKELGPRGVRVNAILPGLVETEGATAAGFTGDDFAAGIVAQTPLGRIGQPDDIADVAVFLASEDSRWLTGEQLVVSGGVR